MARGSAWFLLISACWASYFAGPTQAQSLVPWDQIPTSGLTLEVRKFAKIPLESGTMPRVSFLTTAPGDNRMFVATHGAQAGTLSTARIYTLTPNTTGGASVGIFLAVGAVLNNVNGPVANGLEHTREGGLRTVAFHPDFANPSAVGYRKFYTSHMESTAGGNATLPYVGPTNIADIADSVVGEWSVGANGLVDPGSYREVLRVALPWYAHPAKQIAFNPLSQPGDEDYGLLYFAHGDAGLSTTGTGQVGTNALGKLLRINPLQDGSQSYSIPSTNPFTPANDPTNQVLDEVYALGFRNPHRYSWAVDDAGAPRMLLSDIGYDNVEEINVIEAGNNYGWRTREGTFAPIGTGTGTGLGMGITELPANDWALNDFVYPAAQYGHPGTGGTSPPTGIVGGFAIQNRSDPAIQGQYFFGDFPESGKIFHVPLADLLAAKTRLADGELPTTLSPATIHEVQMLFDDDADPGTPSIPMSMRDIIRSDPDFEGGERVETFFGRGPRGEMYITNKRNGWIYLVTNTAPLPSCDFDGDRACDGTDVDLLTAAIVAGTHDPFFDMTGDGTVDTQDRDAWLVDAGAKNLGAPYLPGDADLNGIVDGSDFNLWNANKFTNVAAWTAGDFTSNGVIDGSDFNVWNTYKFTSSAVGTAVVPEPACGLLIAVSCWCGRRRPPRKRT